MAHDGKIKEQLDAIYADERAILQFDICNDLYKARFKEKTYFVNDFHSMKECGRMVPNAFFDLSSVPFADVMGAGQGEEIVHV